MNTTLAGTHAAARTNGRLRRTIRIRHGLFALTALLALSQPVAAQSAAEDHGRWSLLLSSGTVIPTGEQRDAIERGDMSTAQLSYMIRPAIAINATVGWARSQDIIADHDRKLDVFTYDVGVEARANDRVSRGIVTLTPFAGAGAGARSYSYRRFDADATHNVAGYASVGGILGVGPIHLRVEARNYVTGFRPLDGAGTSGARNDVVLLAGLSFER